LPDKPPYSIGLLGKWGTGKSSIKAIYQARLDDDSARSKRIKTITFNAWRYGGENMKRALLRHVFLELGGEESQLRDELFRHLQREEPEKRNQNERLIDTGKLLLAGFGVGIGLVMAVAAAAFYLKWLLNLSDERLVTVVVSILATGFGYLIKTILEARQSTKITRIEPPSSSAEEYEHFLIEQMKTFKKSKQGASCERLVVFVDDLDRLSTDEMVRGLDAIRTFMEIPPVKLPNVNRRAIMTHLRA
jgi:hypothetical protein